MSKHEMSVEERREVIMEMNDQDAAALLQRLQQFCRLLVWGIRHMTDASIRIRTAQFAFYWNVARVASRQRDLVAASNSSEMRIRAFGERFDKAVEETLANDDLGLHRVSVTIYNLLDWAEEAVQSIKRDHEHQKRAIKRTYSRKDD